MALKTAIFLAAVLMMEVACGQTLKEFDDITGAVLGDKLRNYQLLNHTIRTLRHVTSFIQCGMQCVNLAGCKSLNYCSVGGVCELNGATRLDFPEDLVKVTLDRSIIYLDRDSPILMMEESLTCPCCNHSCVNGAYCVPAAPSIDLMRNYTCVCDDGWRGDYCAIMEVRWSSWSTWSQCSKTCGKGHRMRTRVCQGSNANSRSCDGVDSEYRNCWNNETCAEWASWNNSGVCSSVSKCGYGTVNRTRECRGDGCVGENSEVDRCRSVSCDVPWRLVGGSSPGQGRLEVYSNIKGEWGTVCSSNWDWEDTVVACRTLGYLPPPLVPEPGNDVCDPGWLHKEGFCYLFTDFESIPFSEAQEVCSQQSSHLVSILSENEESFLEDIASSMNKKIWLNAQSVKQQGKTYTRPQRWLDGNLFIIDRVGEHHSNGDKNWDDGSTTQQCLLFEKNKHWHAVKKCDEKIGVALCKKLPYNICDPGWLHNEGFCYLFTDFESISFSEAQEVCSQQSSHLVSILSEQEESFIRRIADNNNKTIWLNAQSVDQGGNYTRPQRWLDGNLFSIEKHHANMDIWDDNSPEPQCLLLEKGGNWHVKKCDEKKAVALCKKLPYFSLRFGPGDGAIHLKNMQCRGCENHLSQCSHSNWHDSETCDHGQDVGLTCVVACPTYRTDGFSNTRFPFRPVDTESFRVIIAIQSAGTVRIVLSRSEIASDFVYTITLSKNQPETKLTYHGPSGTSSQAVQPTSDAILDENKFQDIWIVGNNGTLSVSTTAAGAPFLEWSGGSDAHFGELRVGFDSTHQAFWKFKSFC